jgi:hypothetical protein
MESCYRTNEEASHGKSLMVAIKKDQEKRAFHTEAVYAGPLGYAKLNKLNLPTELIVYPLQALSCAVLGVLYFAWFRPKTAREIVPAEFPQLANKVAEFL